MGKQVDDLALIKKDYGEDMMHFCRFHFATMLEEPMLLYHILSSSFAPNKFLFNDLSTEKKLNNFKDFVSSYFLPRFLTEYFCSLLLSCRYPTLTFCPENNDRYH